jgi:thiamine-phosphate pyrophosphorylase
MAAIKDAKVLSYFTVGPVFPSLTHPDYKPVGLGLIKEVAALNPTLPFFGIGGINRANLKDLIKAGARRVAASSSPLQDPELEETARYYSDQLKG